MEQLEFINRLIKRILTAVLLLASFALHAQTNELTYYDRNTGLTWQKGGDGVLRSWEEAALFCRDLNLASRADWRLPNVKELNSIMDRWRVPLINENHLDLVGSSYWAFTPYQPAINQAWEVNYGAGWSFPSIITKTLHVRCVRGG